MKKGLQMAAQNTLTVRFKAEGKDELKLAFTALSNASNKLAKSQQQVQLALSKVKHEFNNTGKTVEKSNREWVKNNRNLHGGKDLLSKYGSQEEDSYYKQNTNDDG